MKTVDLVRKYNHIFHTDYTQNANCEAAYIFAEGSGTTVDDVSSESNAGTFASSGHPAWAAMSGTNAPTYAPYMVDYTPNDYISCGVTNIPGRGQAGSVVSWANFDEVTTGGALVARWGGSGVSYYSWLLSVSGGKLYARWIKPDNQGYYPNGDTTLGTGQWYHCAMTYNGTTGICVYVDGVLDNSSSPYYNYAAAADATQVVLGANQSGAGYTGYINGKQSESAIFSDVLTSTEINEIMDYGLKPTASAALTGTITNDTEADIVTGSSTIILTLTGDTWVTAGATFDGQRQNIINGIDSAQSEANGWDAVVKAGLAVTDVVRTSDTVVTITLPAFATYNITATETITATIPATALTGAAALVASPTFQVTATATSTVRLLAMTGVGS